MGITYTKNMNLFPLKEIPRDRIGSKIGSLFLLKNRGSKRQYQLLIQALRLVPTFIVTVHSCAHKLRAFLNRVFSLSSYRLKLSPHRLRLIKVSTWLNLSILFFTFNDVFRLLSTGKKKFWVFYKNSRGQASFPWIWYLLHNRGDRAVYSQISKWVRDIMLRHTYS